MGADTFSVHAVGKTAGEAFNKAVEQARYDYGHRGYTGTIAEKRDFVMIPYNKEKDGEPRDFVRKLIDDGDQRIDDKWGPAGCIDIGSTGSTHAKDKGNHEFVFFGWASS